MENVIDKLTSRHIARLLDRVKEVGTPEIVLNEIKREFWYLADDIKNTLQGEEKNHVFTKKTPLL